MAGAADRENEAPGDRQGDLQPLQISAIVTCDSCNTDFDHTFTFENVYDKESIDGDEEHTEEVVCPECSERFPATYDGWVATSDAG